MIDLMEVLKRSLGARDSGSTARRGASRGATSRRAPAKRKAAASVRRRAPSRATDRAKSSRA